MEIDKTLALLNNTPYVHCQINYYLTNFYEFTSKLANDKEFQLVKEVWIQELSIESFSGQKRKKLRLQEVKFIQMCQFYKYLSINLGDLSKTELDSSDLSRVIDFLE